ncbi:hypothetical protein PRIC2_012414 [Phytophthora ramorum]
MALLLHDDEVEALEAALSFVDDFPHDSPAHGDLLHDQLHESPMLSSPATESVPTSVEMTGGGGDVVADEELEILLLEVGLSSSPGASSDVKAEPAALVAVSDDGSSNNNTANNGTVTQVNVNGATRRGSRSSGEATSGKTKRRVRLNPNRARDNRKNELAYLRNKVNQMEEQLHSLRQQYIENKDSTTATTTTKSIVDTVGMPPVWRDMAATQQLRREKAERENARLKLVLESQIKLAKSMEAVMQRRTRQQLAGFNGVVGEGVGSGQGSTWDLLLDKDTYDTLLARAEAAYDFRVKQVVRRYMEADRQVVVWVSTASALETSKSPFASFGFREKGYVISKRVRGRDDFSMFQTCCLVSPQISEGGTFDLSTVGTFTEFVLSFMVATITSSQQLIENVLMDQSLSPKKQAEAPSGS